MKFCVLVISIVVLTVLLGACSRPEGATPSEKRDFVLKMRDDTLAELHEKLHYTEKLIQNAAGYAVFSGFDTHILFAGSDIGYGVAVDNSNGDKVFMRMAAGEVGLGFALKGIREVIVFNNKNAFYKFVTSGLNFGAQGEASAQYKDIGGSKSSYVPLSSDIIVFQMAKGGVALKASLGASTFWIDNELNYIGN